MRVRVRLYNQRMYVCLFVQIQENLPRIIACDTCCDVIHNKRNVFKIFKFYLKSNIKKVDSMFDRSNFEQHLWSN